MPATNRALALAEQRLTEAAAELQLRARAVEQLEAERDSAQQQVSLPRCIWSIPFRGYGMHCTTHNSSLYAAMDSSQFIRLPCIHDHSSHFVNLISALM